MAGLQGIKAGNAFISLGLHDTTGRALNGVMRRFRGWGQRLQRTLTAGGRGFAFGAIVAAGFMTAELAAKAFFGTIAFGMRQVVSSIQTAGDLEEFMNVFDVAFGESAASVKDWVEEFREGVGRSRSFVVKTAASFRFFAEQLGFVGEEADNLAKDLTSLSVDWASFLNLPDPDVAWRLRSALQGNYEAVRLLNINLNDKTILEWAKAHGMAASKLTLNQKRAIAYNIVVEQSQLVMGDAIKTADSYQNRLKRLEAAYEDIRLEIGTAVMPVVKEFLGVIQRSAEVLKENAPAILGYFRTWGDWFDKNLRRIAVLAADIYAGLVMTARDMGASTVRIFDELAKGIVSSLLWLAEKVPGLFEAMLLSLEPALKRVMDLSVMLGFRTKREANAIMKAFRGIGIGATEGLRQLRKELEEGYVSGIADAIEEGFDDYIDSIHDFRNKVKESGLGVALYETIFEGMTGGFRDAWEYIFKGGRAKKMREEIEKVAIPPGTDEKKIRRHVLPETTFATSPGIQRRIWEIQENMKDSLKVTAEASKRTAAHTKKIAETLEPGV